MTGNKIHNQDWMDWQFYEKNLVKRNCYPDTKQPTKSNKQTNQWNQLALHLDLHMILHLTRIHSSLKKKTEY